MTTEYSAWSSMIARCRSRRPKIAAVYSKRGITVCRRWAKSYPAFLADMGRRPSGGTLDRKNNSKGYSKANCRWATYTEQNRNLRSNRWFTLDGKRGLLVDWSRDARCQVGLSCLKHRIREGMSLRKAMSKPSNRTHASAKAFGRKLMMVFITSPTAN